MLGPRRSQEREVLHVVLEAGMRMGEPMSKSLSRLTVDTHIVGGTREIQGAALSYMA